MEDWCLVTELYKPQQHRQAQLVPQEYMAQLDQLDL
jgi:hypothetical protein